MPFFIVSGAYLYPGEGSGSVDPYGWSGEAKDRDDAEKQMQDEARSTNEAEDDEDLIEVIDVWEVHPDDVKDRNKRGTWTRMRPVVRPPTSHYGAPMATSKVRVTITFTGRLSGALGVCSDFSERRIIEVPSPFTVAEANEVARVALYFSEGDSPAYERVTVRNVAFN